MQPQYTTAFDIARDGAPASSFLYIGFGAAAVGFLLLTFRSRGTNALSIRQRLLLLSVWAVVVALITRSAIHNARLEFAQVTDALRSGAFVLVEGMVTNYHATSRQGQSVQEFDVNNHHYSFAPYRRSVRSARSLPKAPPLRDGSQVRIADLNGAILRLEVGQSPQP
ncbi:MAG: hypothetical protein ABI852_13825 [Gemmatimonadaceae bacterium]